MKLTKSQSYSNMLKDIEVSLEKDIADYLDGMTEDDKEKLPKYCGFFHYGNLEIYILKINGISLWVKNYDLDYEFEIPISSLSLQDKLTLLETIEKTL